jgi:anti-anti-sigma factor
MDDKETTMNVTKEGDLVTITCDGAMDLHNSKPFHDALLEAAVTAKAVTVDFRAVEYIDTAVLADLAVAANRMIARGNRLQVMVSEPSHPLRTLQITGFSAVLDVLTEPKPTPAE